MGNHGGRRRCLRAIVSRGSLSQKEEGGGKKGEAMVSLPPVGGGEEGGRGDKRSAEFLLSIRERKKGNAV